MRTDKIIGWLLITGALATCIPYSVLTVIFEYPGILRQEPGLILTRFYEGGDNLILTWFSFAITGMPLIPAYILIGQKLEKQSPLVRIATTFGIIGLMAQVTGLLRWTFVVPVLANTYVNSPDEIMKSSVIIAFETMHQFAGVLLGEHLGQFFTIIWTFLISIAFADIKLFPEWLSWLGSLIYLIAQGELLATAIPGFPAWELAGVIGSTLWLLWLIITGILFLRAGHN